MALLDREDRRMTTRRRPVTEREEDTRQRDLGYILGMIGLGALTFVVGRATAPGASCCDDLTNANLALLLCASEVDANATG